MCGAKVSIVKRFLILTIFCAVLFDVCFCLQCQDDDEDCREQFMHPDMSDHKLNRRSVDNEVLSEYWLDKGERFVAYKDATAEKPVRNKAKNIIFFLGDGMSLTTLAATRVYLGGEEQSLSFETFADTGLAKTYALDRLVPDSACTATAFLCGVKANYGTIGVSGHVMRGDCEASNNTNYHVESIAKWALDAKRSVGFVTTSRVTDATPAGLYAHTAERDWENDKQVNKDCGDNSAVSDIALQLMQGEVGKRFKVIMGGGKSQFIDEDLYDEGKRTDGRNLVQDFLNSNTNNVFVETREDMLAVNDFSTKRLLGLFNDGHMKYHLKALDSKKNKQPTLTEMTEKAIQLLSSNNDNGYFLFVEAGRIDTAHHNNKAKLALDETAQLSEAVELARSLTNMEDTLIVVSSDHSHTMSVSGYSQRGNDIFKLASIGEDELPYMTLSYANGPGFKQFYNTKKHYREDPRDILQALKEEDYDLQFPATAPMDSETHGGEDVPVYASGPWSDIFSGAYEQSTLPYLMAFAGCFGPGEKAC
ncbi:membrane-bound alkaline phosphatase-like [Calliphora vicina]|uniref:membrane-bound alkaline phosphatase-like n=1 Tax=Calliphora vicina TaxID=7373 RepID=UPI00325A4AB4